MHNFVTILLKDKVNESVIIILNFTLSILTIPRELIFGGMNELAILNKEEAMLINLKVYRLKYRQWYMYTDNAVASIRKINSPVRHILC